MNGRHVSVQSVLLCACLACGLLFDPMGFLRMALVCAVVHECAHVLAFAVCTRRLPELRFELGGIGMWGTHLLSRTAELVVLAAGPCANFLFSAVLLALAERRARYGLYFMSAVSLCTGLYNLLPFGVLDGARILQNLIPAEKIGALCRFQRAALCLFCAAAVGLALLCPMPPCARITALLGPGYLLVKEKIER